MGLAIAEAGVRLVGFGVCCSVHQRGICGGHPPDLSGCLSVDGCADVLHYLTGLEHHLLCILAVSAVMQPRWQQQHIKMPAAVPVFVT